MIRAIPSMRWQSCDLLPHTYRLRNRIQQILLTWLMILCALTAILIGVAAATLIRAQRKHLANQQLASAALPLMKLRSDVLAMQDRVRQQSARCQSTEAARPDDSLLQTLGAVALASQSGQREIVVDSVHLRLPIEYDLSATESPEWAIPVLSVHARTTRPGSLSPWIDRLNQFDRIDGAAVAAGSDGNDLRWQQDVLDLKGTPIPIRITATPIATGVLP